MRPIDMTGQRFGKLLVQRRSPVNSTQNAAQWLCKCDCGNETTVIGILLRNGRTRSCGCLHADQMVALVVRGTKHGHATKGITPTYHTWASMLARCENPNNTRYADWGGRGIRVCDRWHDFRNFLSDMGEKPKAHSIDRINNDGNYEPGNCRWATMREQNRNRRNTKRR